MTKRPSGSTNNWKIKLSSFGKRNKNDLSDSRTDQTHFRSTHGFEEIDHEYPKSGYGSKIDQLIESLGLEKYSQDAARLRSTIALCNLHLQTLKKREACEIVIWGKVLSETLGEIEFFEEEKQREVEQRATSGSNFDSAEEHGAKSRGDLQHREAT